MKKIPLNAIVLGVAFGSLAGLGCSKKSETPEIPKVVVPTVKTSADVIKNSNLVWQDEFTGTALDRAKWNYRGVGTLRNYATVSENTISLDGNGNLVMKVTKDANGVYNVGQVSTDGIFAQKYGYFECRAKMNTGIGPHVAFWLQTNTMSKTNNDPANNGTEIDIFEYHRKTPTLVHHNLHWNGYTTGFHQQVGATATVPGIGADFHTFGLEWNETTYIFYVDGKETWRTDKAISKIPEYIILSTELTGFGGDPALGTYPDAVTFDYVRVYQPK